MKPVKFKGHNCTYAKEQPEYMPLPAYRSEDGVVVSCWELSDEEIQQVIENKKIWLSMMTFNKPLQPVYLAASSVEVGVE